MQASIMVKGPRALPLSAPLKQLIDALRPHRERISQGYLLALVQEQNVSLHDVADFCSYHSSHYVRNLIHRSQHAEVLCMCWQSGQRSPIHDHNQSNCVVRVLAGVMTNIDYQLLPSGYVVPTASHEYNVGEVEARSEEKTHQVANLQATGCNLVTLHVYSPPLTLMNVYDIDKPHAHKHWYPQEKGIDGEGI